MLSPLRFGIAFEGDAYPWPFMLGDVHIDWDLPYGMSGRERPHRWKFISTPLPTTVETIEFRTGGASG